MFTACVVFLGAVSQAAVIGASASLLANLDKHSMLLRNRLDEINAHLAYHKIDTKLCAKIGICFVLRGSNARGSVVPCPAAVWPLCLASVFTFCRV